MEVHSPTNSTIRRIGPISYSGDYYFIALFFRSAPTVFFDSLCSILNSAGDTISSQRLTPHPNFFILRGCLFCFVLFCFENIQIICIYSAPRRMYSTANPFLMSSTFPIALTFLPKSKIDTSCYIFTVYILLNILATSRTAQQSIEIDIYLLVFKNCYNLIITRLLSSIIYYFSVALTHQLVSSIYSLLTVNEIPSSRFVWIRQ
jgi:hypothetical protein